MTGTVLPLDDRRSFIRWTAGSPGPGRLATCAAVGAAMFVAQWAAVQLWVPGVAISSVWLQGGLLLAVLLLAERRAWPALLGAGAIGVLAVLLLLRAGTPGVVLGVAALHVVHTWLLADLLERVAGRPVTLEDRRQFAAYSVVVLIAGTALISLLFAALAFLFRFRPNSVAVWRTYALSALLGYLTVTPSVLLFARQWPHLRALVARRRVELATLLLLLTASLGAIFLRAAGPSQPWAWAALATALPALLVWTTFRLGALGASASLLLVTVVATLATNRGLGPFANVAPGTNTLWLQIFLLAAGVPLLALGTLLSHNQRDALALRRSRRRLQRLNRSLLRSRESEAQRIARELHDDIGHRLALASIGLSRVRRQSSAEAAGEIARLQEQVHETALSVRRLSHELHPAHLEHLGIAEALRARCLEVEAATGLSVRCIVPDQPPSLAPETSLCLYRVAQEALSNVVRHAHARHVVLTLREVAGGRAELTIVDDGRGFDPAKLDRRAAFGLLSMSERLRSVGGKATVRSMPDAGTVVLAVVPLAEAPGA